MQNLLQCRAVGVVLLVTGLTISRLIVSKFIDRPSALFVAWNCELVGDATIDGIPVDSAVGNPPGYCCY